MTTKKGDIDHEPTDAAIDALFATNAPLLFSMFRGRLVLILPIGTPDMLTQTQWLEAIDTAIQVLEDIETRISESGVQA